MFSLQPRDELVFGTPIIYQRDKIMDDLIQDHSLFKNNIFNFSNNNNNNNSSSNNKAQKRREREVKDECNIRRVMHRDIERKRRKEMSELYASLQSLLPMQHIQGKRYIADHMLEAVNYIKRLQDNIQELKIQRDKLKKISNLSDSNYAISSNGSSNLPKCVTVNLGRDGMEILISNSNNIFEFGLSRVLAVLLERGLNVISCVSTKIKGRFLHRIQAETSDATNFDLAGLQERLANVVS